MLNVEDLEIQEVDMLKMQIVTRSLVRGVMSTCDQFREEIVERFQGSVGREHLPKRSKKKRKYRASFLHPWDNPRK